MLFLVEKDNTIYGVYNNYNIMVENMKYLKIENFKILKFNINMVSYDIVKIFRSNNSNNNKIFILKSNIDYIGIYDSLEKAKKIISFLDKLEVNKTYDIYYSYINSINVSKYVEKKKVILTDDMKKELAEKELKLGLEKYELNKELNELKIEKKRLDEKKNQYETDLKLYNIFKKKENFTIPELFIEKFNLFQKLEKNNTLNFDNYANYNFDNYNGKFKSLF
jgi:hypothetical protein